MGFLKRLTPGAIAVASLLAVSLCLLALHAWQAAAQPAGATHLIERHQGMSARLDGLMICMLQVEMAHERYLAGGQLEDRSGRDKALATLGAALRAVDPAMLEETGHAPRFYLLQQHVMRRLPAWLDAGAPAPASAPASSPVSARGMLRTGVRLPQAPPGEERLLAARETQVLDTLRAERSGREQGARTALALLGAAALLALGLAGVHAMRGRTGSTPRPAPASRQAGLEYDAAIAARERQRIARDMHDGIGQDLYALKLELQRFHAHTRRAHPRLHQDLGQVLGLADDVMANLRSVIDDLRPDGLEHGLAPALHGLADKFRRRAGSACAIAVQIDAQCGIAALPSDGATVLFRILQEALANVRRHAHATQVRVQLAQRGDGLCLMVSDNGCGFDPAACARPGSFGLAGMRERVDACGGQLNIDSAPGRGTVLTATIALAPPPACG